MASSNYAEKIRKQFARKSIGSTGGFVTDITGVLVKLESPSDLGRKDTWEYEGEERAQTWRATIRTESGACFYWNWPAYIDEDHDNMPGVDIIKSTELGIDDLMDSGIVCRFYRDPTSHRSSVTPIETATVVESVIPDIPF